MLSLSYMGRDLASTVIRIFFAHAGRATHPHAACPAIPCGPSLIELRAPHDAEQDQLPSSKSPAPAD